MNGLYGLTVEGSLTIKTPGEAVQPRGWKRITLAWRCLRGKSIVFASPVSIESCVFHSSPGIQIEASR